MELEKKDSEIAYSAFLSTTTTTSILSVWVG